MLGSLARGAYVLFLTAMIVAWAVSVGKSAPQQPQTQDAVITWWC